MENAIWWVIPVAYLVGSVNFAILLFKLLGLEDPRLKFSGNPGVTNVYRLAGRSWAGVVLVLDVGKACLATWIGMISLSVEWVIWIGFFLILGNRFPCFHKFKGGKGVASYLGFSVLVAPLFTGISLVVWLIGNKISRYSFVASFMMLTVLGAGSVIGAGWRPVGWAATFFTLGLIGMGHKKNIQEYLQDKRSTQAS